MTQSANWDAVVNLLRASAALGDVGTRIALVPTAELTGFRKQADDQAVEGKRIATDAARQLGFATQSEADVSADVTAAEAAMLRCAPVWWHQLGCACSGEQARQPTGRGRKGRHVVLPYSVLGTPARPVTCDDLFSEQFLTSHSRFRIDYFMNTRNVHYINTHLVYDLRVAVAMSDAGDARRATLGRGVASKRGTAETALRPAKR